MMNNAQRTVRPVRKKQRHRPSLSYGIQIPNPVLLVRELEQLNQDSATAKLDPELLTRQQFLYTMHLPSLEDYDA